MMSMSCTSTRVPAGGTPMNSPCAFPWTLTRATVLSPLAIRSSTFMRIIGKRGQQDPEELQRPLLRGRKTWPALVLDEIIRYQVADPAMSPALIRS